MKKELNHDFLAEIFEREFDPRQLTHQLSLKKLNYMCWGVHKAKAIRDEETYDGWAKAFYFRVSGLKFTGDIVITLGWEDLWKAYFFEPDGTYLKCVDHIYADVLCDTIDSYIENTNSPLEVFEDENA